MRKHTGPQAPFWKVKPPEAMTRREWESLCDGCARCCLQKLEYEDTGEIRYTCIVCRYLDEAACRCRQYERRTVLVPTCLRLRPDTIRTIKFLPRTCAYRLIAEGRDLPWWHPLVSGSLATVHAAGISVRGRVVREEYVHPESWEEHIIDWAE